MLTIHFFAGLRELAHTPELELPWEPFMSVSSLRTILAERFPDIAPLLARSSIAINNQLVQGDAVLPQDAEIAFLPPVSGG